MSESVAFVPAKEDKRRIVIRSFGIAIRVDADDVTAIYQFVRDHEGADRDLLAPLSRSPEWGQAALREDIAEETEAWYRLDTGARETIGYAVLRKTAAGDGVSIRVVLGAHVRESRASAIIAILRTLTKHAQETHKFTKVHVVITNKQMAIALCRIRPSFKIERESEIGFHLVCK